MADTTYAKRKAEEGVGADLNKTYSQQVSNIDKLNLDKIMKLRDDIGADIKSGKLKLRDGFALLELLGNQSLELYLATKKDPKLLDTAAGIYGANAENAQKASSKAAMYARKGYAELLLAENENLDYEKRSDCAENAAGSFKLALESNKQQPIAENWLGRPITNELVKKMYTASSNILMAASTKAEENSDVTARDRLRTEALSAAVKSGDLATAKGIQEKMYYELQFTALASIVQDETIAPGMRTKMVPMLSDGLENFLANCHDPGDAWMKFNTRMNTAINGVKDKKLKNELMVVKADMIKRYKFLMEEKG